MADQKSAQAGAASDASTPANAATPGAASVSDAATTSAAHGYDWYHPWATAAVIGSTTVTILAIGTRVTTVPVDCVSVVANGMAYQHCGPTWHQPQYVGSSVQYIVVAAP